MKRLNLTLIVAIAVCFIASAAYAQPYTSNIANDVYGVQQGGSINGIPTPKDNNDTKPGTDPTDINDAINLLYNIKNNTTGQNYFNRNKDVDHLQWTFGDKTWREIAKSGAPRPTYVLIGLTAGNDNTLRVYDADAASPTYFPVLGPTSGFGFSGDGTQNNPFIAGVSPFTSPAQNFGWNLLSQGNKTIDWDSQPGLNDDKLDHMMTYNLAALANTEVWIKTGCDFTGAPEVTNVTCTTVTKHKFNSPFLIAWEDLPLTTRGLLGDEDYDDMMFLVDSVFPHTPEPMTMVLFGSGLLGLVGLKRKKS